MPKKRKLNSSNPKYMSAKQKNIKKVKRKELACTICNGVKVYKVWYE
tara:strand:- start:11 stop:151 length:141 start_codon:yes stop_codon:yes gene_type:complete